MTEMLTIVIAVASFLAGVVITAASYTYTFSNRLVKLETKMSNLCEQVGKIPVITLPCALHLEIEKQIAVNQERIKELKEELEKKQ